MKKCFIRSKSIVTIVLAVIMAAGVILNPITADAAKSKKKDGVSYAVGDDLAFGYFDGNILSWTILSYDDTTKLALVVTRKPLNSKSITAYRGAIDQMYRTTGGKAGYVRWSENYWRGWLNQSFYKECFNDTERAMIQKTTLSEQSAKDSILNFYHDTTMDANYVHGQKKNSLNVAIYNSQTTTSDYIFFLSTDEFTTYKDTIKGDTSLVYPLRTNAYDDPAQGLFANEGDKLIYRMYYYTGDSIRPAMYVKLGETEEETKDSSTSTTDKNSKDTSSKTKTTSADTKATATNTSATKTTDTTTTEKTATTEKASNSKKYANNGTNTGNITLPDDSNYAMSTGSTAQVAIDMEYLNSTDKQFNVTYTSSDAGVFTVDSNGLITATGKGTGNVTVRMKKSNGKIYTMSCRIDVS